MKKLNFLFIAILAVAAGLMSSCSNSTDAAAPTITFTSPSTDSVEVTKGDAYTFKGTVTADVEAELTEIHFFNGADEFTNVAVTITDGSLTYDFSVEVTDITTDFTFKVVAYDNNDKLSDESVEVIAKEIPMKEYTGVSFTYTSTELTDNNMFNAETGAVLSASGAAADMDLAFVWQSTYGYSVVSPDSEWMKTLWGYNSLNYNTTDKSTTKIAISSKNFDTVTAADLQDMSVTTAVATGGGNGVQGVSTGNVIEFETADGYKGLMKVNSSSKVTKYMTADFKVVAPAAAAK